MGIEPDDEYSGKQFEAYYEMMKTLLPTILQDDLSIDSERWFWNKLQGASMKSIFVSLTLVLTFIAGCTSESSTELSETDQTRLLDSLNAAEHIRQLDSLTVVAPDAQPVNTIQFQKELIVAEQYLPNRPAPPFSGGPKIAVDNEDRTYMVNQYKNTINVFDKKGSRLDDIGREGRGPGEFIAIGGIDIYKNKLITTDASLLRIQVFSLDSRELLNIIKIRSQQELGRPGMIYRHTDSTFFTGYSLNQKKDRSYRGYYILNNEFEIISDKIMELESEKNYQFTLDNGGVASFRLSFSRKGIWAMDDSGQIYQANTGEFLIKNYRPDGTYQQAFYHPFKNDPLEEREFLDKHESIHGSLDQVEFTDTWPALESMFVDDENRIWVSTIINDHKSYKWFILDDSGTLLATFSWPRDKPIEAIKNNKMYVSITDRDKGIRQVIRYNLVLTPIEK